MSAVDAGGPAQPVDVNSLVYKHEGPLLAIHIIISTIVWLALILGTLGIALVYVLVFFIAYLFAQSGLIAWIRGNGVRITAEQFPDLHKRYMHCCRTLGMTTPPDAYVVNGQGVLNAFATKFLGHYFVVLNSNVVDSMMEEPEAINFYMGHELSHVARKHLVWHTYISPSTLLPLIGAGYHRAREYTCDAFGRACCSDALPAVHGLTALAAGEKRWAVVNLAAYVEQVRDTSGFWMSFHELVADYPWIVKRVARIAEPNVPPPGRNPFAWVLALFVPRLGLAAGGGAGALVFVAVIGILAAIAIPAYQDYTIRAKMAEVVMTGQAASDSVAKYYGEKQALPRTIEEAGYTNISPSVRDISINPKNGVVTLTLTLPTLDGKTLTFTPSRNADKQVTWRCSSQEIAPKYLPPRCR